MPPLCKTELIDAAATLENYCYGKAHFSGAGRAMTCKTASYSGPHGSGFTATIRPHFLPRLQGVFKGASWTDPLAPTLTVAVPPSGHELVMMTSEGTSGQNQQRFECASRDDLQRASQIIESAISNWVTRHLSPASPVLPLSPKP